MDLYGFLLFLHVLAAAFWAGGALMSYVLIERMNTTNERSALRALIAQFEHVGQVYFMPAGIVTLVAGLLLVWRGDWGWDQPFVMVGMVGIVITIVLGAAVMPPKDRALVEALDSPDSTDGAVRAAFAQVRTLARIDLALLVVIIFFMTVKPGT